MTPEERSSGGGVGIHPLVGLMRGFVVDWLECADPAAATRIMVPGYTAVVGGVTLRGVADAYLPATLGQLRRFPGLMVTVHDLFVGEDQVAMRFTEHGCSIEQDGAAAAWAGIGIFGWDGDCLTSNVSEEDYLSRRRQLASASPDPVAPPATAPWAAVPRPPDPEAEAVVRQWLDAGDLSAGGGVQIDDGWTGQATPNLVEQDRMEIDTFLCAGRRVAFHATQRGRYVGGIEVPVPPIGAEVALRCTGMLDVDGGAVRGHVVRDRVGLRRDLLALSPDAAAMLDRRRS